MEGENLLARLNDFLAAFWAAAGAAVAGAAVFLVRRVMTSAAKIDHLEEEIERREEKREEEHEQAKADRETMIGFMAETKSGIEDIHRDQSEMREDIKRLFRGGS